MRRLFLAILPAAALCLCGAKPESAAKALAFEGPRTLSLANSRHVNFVRNASARQKLKDKTPASVANPERSGKEDSHPQGAVFTWKLPPDTARAVFVISGGSRILRYDVTGKERLELFNLELARNYYCALDVVTQDGKCIRALRRLKTADQPPRWLKLPEISNARDIGGWKTADGKFRIRQGLLYRGGAFDKVRHLTQEGKRIFCRDLGIKTDIDLRGLTGCEPGLEKHPLAEYGVAHFIEPVSLDYDAPQAQLMFVRLFHEFAKPHIYPAYCHCAGGADRTGALMFLLEGVLGLDDETLFTEYELTSFSVYGARSRKGRLFGKLLRKLESYGDASVPLRDKAVRYLLEIGVPQADIDAIRNIFLEKVIVK